MSGAATRYLRLLRKVVRDSACRLGGAEEILLTSDLSEKDTATTQRPAGRDGPVDRASSARLPRGGTSRRAPGRGIPVERDESA